MYEVQFYLVWSELLSCLKPIVVMSEVQCSHVWSPLFSCESPMCSCLKSNVFMSEVN